jgi:hypothetical protein
MIPIPILEGTMLLLQECEPENVVFLDGEADLEIEQDPPLAAPPSIPEPAPEEEQETPFTQMPELEEQIDFSQMFSPTSVYGCIKQGVRRFG